jgi:hypothetical protein
MKVEAESGSEYSRCVKKRRSLLLMSRLIADAVLVQVDRKSPGPIVVVTLGGSVNEPSMFSRRGIFEGAHSSASFPCSRTRYEGAAVADENERTALA